ncbi:LemA family protein [Georgenia soli]|uniref:LemA family protein n=1 Tax=Georgenia soli TaxID=638953 RepID=A0A2A9EGH1_9MICO|nr:hypothetical protein [Georgenia soli]PFG37943.1 LemA family protein [Georgenia soli]
MGLTEWTLVVVAALAVVLVVLWRQAVRVDRLHRTVLRSRATLEAQLARRATAATELAACGALDPAEAMVVADVALRACDAAAGELVRDGLEGSPETGPLAGVDNGAAGAADRGLLESELSRTLRTVLGPREERDELAADPRAAGVMTQLHQAWYRLQLARRFHNSHVEQVRRLRANSLVRAFHLAGRAPLPEPFDMDDALPAD